jgi:hypothetical protein
VLIAADDALKSAAQSVDRTSVVDKKFREAIHLLSGFDMDPLSEDPMSGPAIGGTDTRNVKSDKSKSPSTILHALKENLHAKVKFPSVSLSLDVDESQPMGNEWPKLTRVVEFHLLSSLPDSHPIVVKRGCHAFDVAQSLSDSDSCARAAQWQSKPSRDSVELQPFQGQEAVFDSQREPPFLCRAPYIAGGIWGQSQNRPYRGFSTCQQVLCSH